MPRRYLDIYEAVRSGDLEGARRSQATVNDVIQELLNLSPGVVPGIKFGLKLLGYDLGEARRPFLPITQDTSRFEALLLNSEGMR